MKNLPGRDFAVRLVPLPNTAVDGCVISNGDGTATIVINSRVSEERQRRAYRHEVCHLENDDLYSQTDVMEAELRAGEAE